MSAVVEDKERKAETMESGSSTNSSAQDMQKNSKKSKKKRINVARRIYIPNWGCFPTERAHSYRDRVSDAADNRDLNSDSGGPSPTHLLLMINGIVGSASNWRYAAKKFEHTYRDDLLVHCSRCNHTIRTFDGVDVMGERLADEVISLVEKNPKLQKISFVCHSLGGLISRYAIAMLYGTYYLSRLAKLRGEPFVNGSLGESLKQKYQGKIAGLEPANFITAATPHLGTRGHKQVPMFCGLYKLENVAHHISWILGRSGRHLFLEDKDGGNPPLLLQMANDLEDYPYITALRSFRRRVVYSNVHFDLIVGWTTSSLRHRSELPNHHCLLRNETYKNILNSETSEAAVVEDICSWEYIANRWKNLTTEEMTEIMLRGLTRLRWERIDVKFKGPEQKFRAHSTIQVQSKWLHFSGADVIQHMVDNFCL